MKNSVKFIIAIGLLFGGLMPVGCDWQTKSRPPRSAPEVATVTVSTQSVLLTTELPGRTSPHLVAEIRPQVNGLIQKRLFTEGSNNLHCFRFLLLFSDVRKIEQGYCEIGFL